MIQPDLLATLVPVVETLERLGVRYLIGGSVASSTLGVARTTIDVDLVADLRDEHVAAVVSALSGTYYVDKTAIQDAIRRRSSFNLIHLVTMLKVDVFVVAERPFDRTSFGRVRRETLEDVAEARSFNVASAEDVVLHKLEWFRKGGEVSERQWHDCLGVLRVRAAALDWPYLEHWAGQLGVSDLLARAWRDAQV